MLTEKSKAKRIAKWFCTELLKKHRLLLLLLMIYAVNNMVAQNHEIGRVLFYNLPISSDFKTIEDSLETNSNFQRIHQAKTHWDSLNFKFDLDHTYRITKIQLQNSLPDSAKIFADRTFTFEKDTISRSINLEIDYYFSDYDIAKTAYTYLTEMASLLTQSEGYTVQQKSEDKTARKEGVGYKVNRKNNESLTIWIERDTELNKHNILVEYERDE